MYLFIKECRMRKYIVIEQSSTFMLESKVNEEMEKWYYPIWWVSYNNSRSHNNYTQAMIYDESK